MYEKKLTYKKITMLSNLSYRCFMNCIIYPCVSDAVYDGYVTDGKKVMAYLFFYLLEPVRNKAIFSVFQSSLPEWRSWSIFSNESGTAVGYFCGHGTTTFTMTVCLMVSTSWSHVQSNQRDVNGQTEDQWLPVAPVSTVLLRSKSRSNIITHQSQLQITA